MGARKMNAYSPITSWSRIPTAREYSLLSTMIAARGIAACMGARALVIEPPEAQRSASAPGRRRAAPTVHGKHVLQVA